MFDFSCSMDHLNATGQSVTVVDGQQFSLSIETVMNLLAQLDWKAIGLAVLASVLVLSR